MKHDCSDNLMTPEGVVFLSSKASGGNEWSENRSESWILPFDSKHLPVDSTFFFYEFLPSVIRWTDDFERLIVHSFVQRSDLVT